MRLHVFGIGGAGARVVDRLHADYAEDPFLDGTLAFDTDRATLDALGSLPDESRYRFADRAGGSGLDGDLRTGFDIGADHAEELSRVIDTAKPSRAEAFLVVAGLGGATGGGVAPALIRNLRRLYEIPVYVLAILPADRSSTETESGNSVSGSSAGGPAAEASTVSTTDDVGEFGTERQESEEHRPTGHETDEAWHAGPAPDPDPTRPLAVQNARHALHHLDGLANAIILFDDDLWLRHDEQLEDAIDRINGVAAAHIARLFGAGHATENAMSPQQVVDASDVNRALGDRSDFAAIGYAEQAIERPATESRFGLGLFQTDAPASVDTSEAVSVVETVIRKAARGNGTAPVPDGRADRTLLIVGGPPEWLNRDAIAQGRRWLARETGTDAILSGDAPEPDAERVYAIVVRSGIDPPEVGAD